MRGHYQIYNDLILQISLEAIEKKHEWIRKIHQELHKIQRFEHLKQCLPTSFPREMSKGPAWNCDKQDNYKQLHVLGILCLI